MENIYSANQYFDRADMYSLHLRDLIKKMSPMEWKAFEIIVASRVSEEKDAKEVFIKTMIDNGEPCKSEDTAWRIVKSLIKLGLYDVEKLFTGYRNFNVLMLTPVGVRIYRDHFRKEPPTHPGAYAPKKRARQCAARLYDQGHGNDLGKKRNL